MQDTIRRYIAVEVEIHEQLARIQEAVATTKAKLALEVPSVSRKPQLAATFLSFIGQPEVRAAARPGQGESVRACVLRCRREEWDLAG